MANLLHSIMQVPKSSSSGDPVATADTPPATGDIYDPNTLLWTPLFLLPITTGATHSHSFGHPTPNTYLHGGTINTLFLDTPTPIYTTQLWSLYYFRLFV